MKSEELERKVEGPLPNLSADSRMLVELFVPFCWELQEENDHLLKVNKELLDQLVQNSRNSSKQPLSQDVNRLVKQRTEGVTKSPVVGQPGYNQQVAGRKDGVSDRRWQGRHRKRYRALIRQGLAMNPGAKMPDTQTRGVTKQSKPHNLLKRIRGWEEDILRFMTEPLAEFTNNQAERALSMNKVRAKLSGGFRELETAQEFMYIRSLVDTAIKQAVCSLQTLESEFTQGNSDYMRLNRPD